MGEPGSLAGWGEGLGAGGHAHPDLAYQRGVVDAVPTAIAPTSRQQRAVAAQKGLSRR
jgi:hypothetical protein